MSGITLNELGSLGEFVSAIAVIASLIYVGRQVRQHTNATRIATTQAHLDIWNDIVSNFCQSSEMASIWYRGLQDISSLKEGESVQFFAQLGLITRYYESSYLEWSEAALDNQLWEGIKQTLVDQMSYPGARQWWGKRRHWFYVDFRNMVDDVVASGGGQPMYGEEQAS